VSHHRFVACALSCVATVALLAPPATGVTRVRHALLERHGTVEEARALRREHMELEAGLRHRISTLQRTASAAYLAGFHVPEERRAETIAASEQLLAVAHSRLRALDPRTRARLRALHARYANLQRWLDVQGIFRACPVPDYISIADNFGVTVRIPHVPVHIHMGNDVAAPTGAPILAPFDGLASAGHDKLGGSTVRVYGGEGYVYNAHLSAFGSLGWVHAGDVIGFVGTTGDAQGPHDHFEWHPNDGAAVDPHALLLTACVSVASP
jgi:murein DD-endopeptidase MepM/ murein hydrolase activator NlpD